MALNRLPLDTARLSFIVVKVEPKTDYETGEQKYDRDKVPQWTVQLLVTGDEFKSETCDCTVSAKEAPKLEPLTYVQLEKPMAALWQQGTRAGLAISANQVRPANAPMPKPSGNGSEKVPTPA